MQVVFGNEGRYYSRLDAAFRALAMIFSRSTSKTEVVRSKVSREAPGQNTYIQTETVIHCNHENGNR